MNFYQAVKKTIWFLGIIALPLIFFDLGVEMWVKFVFFWIGLGCLISFIFDHFEKEFKKFKNEESSNIGAPLSFEGETPKEALSLEEQIREYPEDIAKLLLDETPLLDKIRQQQISYKINISISPDWFAIVKNCFPALKDNKEIRNFIEELHQDKKLKIVEGEGLLWKNFNFIEFHDGVSGITQTWNDHNKTFVDEIEISGQIFEADGTISGAWANKFPENDTNYPFLITPSEIGFDRIMLAEHDINKTVAQIPFEKILNFLLRIGKNIHEFGSPMFAIKKFPTDLAAEFKKNNINYETWDRGLAMDDLKDLIKSAWAEKNDIELYEGKVSMHHFVSPYYSIGISLKIFAD